MSFQKHHGKSEISVSWYKQFLLETLEEVKKIEDKELVKYFEDRTQTLSGADSVYLLKSSGSSETKYISPTLNRVIEPCKNAGAFSELLKTKQPIFIKDCEKSILYNPDCDNITNQSIKDIFLIPVYIDGRNDTAPPFVFWGSLFQGTQGEISQKNILFILKFVESIKSNLARIDSLIQSPEQYYINQVEELIRQQERTNLYFHNIIHDIRTPMNALMGFMDLLAHNESDEVKSSYIASAIKSAEQMVRLINDALDIAKIEKGELPIEKHPFNPTLELMESVRIFYDAAKKKGITLTTYFDPAIPATIVSDQYRIKQVLSNLLSNAIKFTPKEGAVYVECTYDSESDLLKISVIDTGIGISEEEKKHIFTPYTQANSSIEKEYGGTGLGLSISQQIVSLLGGRLDFDSTKGVGSTFSIVIPASAKENYHPFLQLDKERAQNTSIYLYHWKKRNDPRSLVVTRYLDIANASYKKGAMEPGDLEKFSLIVIDKDYYNEKDNHALQSFLDKGGRVVFLEDVFDTLSKDLHGDVRRVVLPIFSKDFYSALGLLDESDRNIAKEKTAIQSYKGKRVVVVDDNRINLKVMEQILKRFDCEVISYEDASSTVEYLEKEPADLLIIDENMPDMNGSDAIRLIKNGHSKNPDIPIISLTGDVYHKEEILQAGADAIILKPVKINILSKMLAQYLG